jgi:hypothetical protein
MSRITHCLDNQLTDEGEFASLAHRPLSTPKKHVCFCLMLISVRLGETQGTVRLEELDKFVKIIHHIVSRTCVFPGCSILP